MSTGATWFELFDRFGSRWARVRAWRPPAVPLVADRAALLLLAAAALVLTALPAGWAAVDDPDVFLWHEVGERPDGWEWLGAAGTVVFVGAGVVFVVLGLLRAGRRATRRPLLGVGALAVAAGAVVLADAVLRERELPRPSAAGAEVTFAAVLRPGPLLAGVGLVLAATGLASAVRRPSLGLDRRALVLAVAGAGLMVASHRQWLTEFSAAPGESLWTWNPRAGEWVALGGAALMLAGAVRGHPALAVVPAFVLVQAVVSQRELIVWDEDATWRTPVFLALLLAVAAVAVAVRPVPRTGR